MIRDIDRSTRKPFIASCQGFRSFHALKYGILHIAADLLLTKSVAGVTCIQAAHIMCVCSGRRAEDGSTELLVQATEHFEVCRKLSWPER